MIEAIYCKRNGWLALLAQGWGFADPFCPNFMEGHHGQYAIIMVRHV